MNVLWLVSDHVHLPGVVIDLGVWSGCSVPRGLKAVMNADYHGDFWRCGRVVLDD